MRNYYMAAQKSSNDASAIKIIFRPKAKNFNNYELRIMNYELKLLFMCGTHKQQSNILN